MECGLESGNLASSLLPEILFLNVSLEEGTCGNSQ